MENGMQGTFERFEQITFPGLTAGVSDSLVRTSALPENSWDSAEKEAACFSQLCELYKTQKKKIDPHTYLLRTLKTYLVLMEERTSLNFSLRWTKLGMIQNGRFSIPLISECRKTGNGCSLWDIIEENAEPKYFLSMEQIEKIMWNR